MDLIQIYLDEDAGHAGLVNALRSRGVSVFTAVEASLIGKADREQLEYATGRHCVLYSYNASDFHRLHREWVRANRMHAGIILAPQQRFSVGEQLRRILRIRGTVSAEGMRNRIEFLANWD